MEIKRSNEIRRRSNLQVIVGIENPGHWRLKTLILKLAFIVLFLFAVVHFPSSPRTVSGSLLPVCYAWIIQRKVAGTAIQYAVLSRHVRTTFNDDARVLWSHLQHSCTEIQIKSSHW